LKPAFNDIIPYKNVPESVKRELFQPINECNPPNSSRTYQVFYHEIAKFIIYYLICRQIIQEIVNILKLTVKILALSSRTCQFLEITISRRDKIIRVVLLFLE
jgi:hypothetical protein